MILDTIIASKKEEIALLKRRRPFSELKAAIRDLPFPRDFLKAVRNRECAIIAEVKRRSPSRRVLRKDFNPVHIASIYEKNGAAAISVLTDEEYFGGNKMYLEEIKESVNLPLLRKDFIIDPYQIYETRFLHGDALLLIAGILNKDELKDYISLTESLGLYALVEVHSRDELDKALSARPSIIGINNRDLKTFNVDLNTTLHLIPHIPPDISVISESGIHTRKDIEILMNAGIHAFLIGETLMLADNIDVKLMELLGKV